MNYTRSVRRVIGWALDRTMEDDLTLAALRMALTQRSIRPGLVHHSDRGSQYASNEYTDLLWDNAACESFMNTLWRSVVSVSAAEFDIFSSGTRNRSELIFISWNS
jgi:transposase InsO family protein